MTRIARARYTLEFKQEAIRLVQGGQTVASAAKTLGLSDQTLRNWLKADAAGRLREVAGQAVFSEMKSAHGWPRIWRELQARGVRAGKERVRKLMKAQGLRARGKRKFSVNSRRRRTAPMTFPSRRTCSNASFPSIRQTGSGQATSSYLVGASPGISTGGLGQREVLVAGIDGLELAAINRHDGPGEQVELATQHDELSAGRADRRPHCRGESPRSS